jgi:hypothetical protein
VSETTQAALADRLAERTLALVDIPSVSREEAAALAWIRTVIPSEAFEVLDEEDPVLFWGRRCAGSTLPSSCCGPCRHRAPGGRSARRRAGPTGGAPPT